MSQPLPLPPITAAEAEDLRRQLAKTQIVHETLLTIFDAVNTTEDLNQLFHIIHRELGNIFDVTNFYIGLYDEETDIVHFPYAVDEADDHFFPTPNISASPSLTAEIIRQKRPMSFTKKEFMAKASDVHHQAFMGPAAEIWIGAPLRVSGNVFGVIAVQDYHDPNAFTQHDLEILDSVSLHVGIAIDRKRTLDALRLKDAQYKELITNTPSIIIATSTSGIVEFISPAFERLTGHNPNLFLGHPWHDCFDSHLYPNVTAWMEFSPTTVRKSYLGSLIHPDDRDAVLMAIDEALRTQNAYVVDYRIILANGKHRYVSEAGDVTKQRSGYRIEAMIHDIHDRRFAEELNLVLFEISNAVTSAPDLDSLYQKIHSSLGRVIDATNFYIAIYDPDKDLIEFPFRFDQDPIHIEQIHPASKSNGFTAQVIFSGQPVLANREQIEARHMTFGLEGQFGSPAQIWLGVPLKIENQIIGAMVCQSYQDPFRYSHSDMRILMSVSGQVAIAIERRRAFDALRRSEEQVRILSRQTEQFSLAAAALLEKENLQDILNSFCTAIIDHSDYSRVIISLFKNEPPYRDIAAVGGFDPSDLRELAQLHSPPARFLKIFSVGIKLGRLSFYVPHSQNAVYGPGGIILGHGSSPPGIDAWHPHDNMFVRMNDSSGDLIGVISVDNAKSGKKPSSETIRPLEIFSSLISQIILHKRVLEDLDVARGRAEDATQAKSQFLANMSHEIRTPLNAIIGLTDLVLDSDVTPAQQNSLQKIQKAGQSLLAIISDILDFSKIEAGKLVLESTQFPTLQLLSEVFDLLAPQAASKGVELIYHPGPGLPASLSGDPLRVQQILINLLSNAIKFTERGEVTVFLDMVGGHEGKSARFQVIDTGIGISEDGLRGLFESFAQADGSNTRRYGGTGLGLAICKQLVNLMGGTIWVESKRGQGSTFGFTLPGQDLACQSPQDSCTLHCHALVVDNTPATLKAIASMLTELGAPHDLASTAEEAVSCIMRQKSPHDCLLIKESMYMASARLLHEAWDAAHTPIPKIVVLQAANKTSLARNSGADQALIKPVCPDQLALALREMTKTSRQTADVPLSVPVVYLAGRSILVVEDNLINQEVAFRILTKAGASVSIAVDGLEALRFVEQGGFDLILMDLQMPRMDGHEATREIRNRLGLQIPIVAMTAHAMDSNREECLASGMNDFIPKPVDAKHLLATVKALLSAEDPPPAPSTGQALSPDCLDRATALDRLDQDEKTYRSLLHLFLRRHHTIEDILENIEIRNLGDAAKQLHSLRGAAGAIGAIRLVEAIQTLERMLPEARLGQLKMEIDAFRLAHAELLGALHKMEPQEDANPITCDINEDEIRPLLHLLVSNLLENNLKAVNIAHDLAERLKNTTLRDWANVLKDLSDNLDFIAAADVVRQLQNDRPGLRSKRSASYPQQSDRADR